MTDTAMIRSTRIQDRRERNGHGDRRAVLSQQDGFIVLNMLAPVQPRHKRIGRRHDEDERAEQTGPDCNQSRRPVTKVCCRPNDRSGQEQKAAPRELFVKCPRKQPGQQCRKRGEDKRVTWLLDQLADRDGASRN
jgi:hypothetical protein